MTALGLLEDLTRRGIVLTAEADKLRYKAPKGTITPALRGLIEQHRAALLQALADSSGASSGPADGPGLQQTSNKRPTAGSPSTALDQAAGQVAALEAELEALLDELGRARGSWPELARDGHPAHEAYRRFCELERAWLALRADPSQAALVSGHGHQVAQDEADQVTRRAQRDPKRARLDQLLQPRPGGLTPAEADEVRALARGCGVAVRLERLDLADLTAGWHEVTYVT